MKQTNLQIALGRNGLRLSDVARLLGVDKATVSRWSIGKIPAERVLEVERVSGVPRHVLRPDLYESGDGVTSGEAPQVNSPRMVSTEDAA